jgi:tRNA(Ile)-lysidine synthase
VVTRCSGCDDQHAAHFRAGVDLRLGFRRPGLTMRPRGGRGTRKLQDIFVDARVPREDRDTWPLVFAADSLAWVPGVAIDSDLATSPGAIGQHVSVVPYPLRKMSKIAVLESPHSHSGEPT